MNTNNQTIKNSNGVIKKITAIAIFLALLTPMLLIAQPTASATENKITSGLKVFATNAGYKTDTSVQGEQSLKKQIGQIAKLFFGFLGIIMVIIFIYAGFLWMTAGGDDEKVIKAKAWMKNAIIGIIIILAAYIITDFVIRDAGNKFYNGGGGNNSENSM